MRVSQLLLSLVGLVGLTSAEAGELYTCTKSFGEIGGGCGRILALDRCVDLSSIQAGRVRSITQKQGAICYYYPQKGCSTGWRSLEIDTRKGDFEQDVAENVGKQIFSVYCFRPRKAAEAGEEVASSTVIQARSDNTVADTHLPIEVSALLNITGPSDLIVCKDFSSDEPCEALNATDICAPLGPVAHEVRFIYQAAGTVCKFYDHDCSPRWSLMTLNTLSGHRSIDVNAAIGDKLGVVVCRPTWRPDQAHSQPRRRALRAAAPILAPRAVSSITPCPASPSAPSNWEGADDQPLYICRLTNLGGRCTYYREPGCLNNPFGPEEVEPILSIKVRNGWRCVFYREQNCIGESPPHYEEARGGDRLVGDIWYAIGSMSCSPVPFMESSVPQKPLEKVERGVEN